MLGEQRKVAEVVGSVEIESDGMSRKWFLAHVSSTVYTFVIVLGHPASE